MSGLKERLGRLTRSAGSAGGGGLAEPAELTPANQAADPAESRHKETEGFGSLPGRRKPEDVRWAALGFELEEGPAGACLVREAAFHTEYKHGRFAMNELEGVSGALSRLDPAGSALEPRRLLFLDTETTGLGQGAGNVPFLIGIGLWSKDGFTVRQYVIRHPGEEAAMLSFLSEVLQECSHLVTYNGRAFDWPLVKNRYVMHRMRAPKDPGHFDFLYPSRSLWRTTMPSCRLGAVEEAILGVFRHEDVPGSLAPALYFQYLAEGDPSVLSGVIRHNEADILTLLSLAVHFGRLLNGNAPIERMNANELNRLGLWYERLGFETEALRVFETMTNMSREDAYPYYADAAQFYKKRKMWDRAVTLWKAIIDTSRSRRLPTLDPYVELAMAYEHRYKNADEALYWTEEALRSVQTRLSLTRGGTDGKLRSLISDIQKRRERLLKKKRTLF